jgi:uncharacterized protein
VIRARIDIPQSALADFCRRHYIKKMSFFGSVLRDDFRPDSDVDVLVVFEPGHTPGWDIVRIQDELAALLGGRMVDLITEDSLNRRIRKRVLQEAEVEYVHEG